VRDLTRPHTTPASLEGGHATEQRADQVSDPRDWKAGGSPAGRPLPPELDPRGRHRSGGSRPAAGSRAASGPGRRAAGPRRGRRLARALSWLAVLTSMSILAAAGAGYALVNRYDGNINRLDGIFEGSDTPEPVDDGPRTILIVGSDSREGLTGEEAFQGEGDEFVTGQRSDVIILAHLYGGSDQAQLVSFPRDTWVEIPAYTDPETGDFTPAHSGKINSAFQEGGPSLLIQTVQDLTGIDVDNYMQVDFTGFKRIVDELGGVEICLSEAQKDIQSGIDLPAGRQEVMGDQALAFVRQRNGLARGDIDRIARQQQFIGSIVRKVLSAGTLANPLRLNGFLDAATSSLQVDETLAVGDLRDLALRFRGFAAGGVTFTTPPIENISASRGGQSVVLLDEEGSQQLFDRIARDVPPNAPAPTAPATDLIVRPSQISLEVLNGAGIQGLAGRAAADLAEVGFQVVGPPGNRGTDAEQTTVFHGPDKADSARTVAAAIPGATTELDPTLGRTLQVVVGASYDGAQPVEVTPASPPPAAPADEPETRTAAEDPCAT
jgi:LCP family protein required for cell wall assembly